MMVKYMEEGSRVLLAREEREERPEEERPEILLKAFLNPRNPRKSFTKKVFQKKCSNKVSHNKMSQKWFPQARVFSPD